jgi:putative heme-binding domain-containing protein
MEFTMHHRPFPFRRLIALACLSVWAGIAVAQEQDQPDPELERQTFKVAEGFEVSLFAADPLVAKPIEMNFDAKGRLWVATSVVYPMVKPGEVPDDKIVILEDINGDGKAEKARVYAGGLLIPTGVEPGDAGAYVADSTQLVHLGDIDGDLKTDARRVMLSGFGTEDTHHILHTFRWGPDGRLFFNQSIYIHSHIETPWGVQRLNGSGVWRYDPRSAKLEVFARGMINPWGLCWDKWGNTFGTDGAGFGGIHYLFPGAAFESATEVKRTLQGLNPGSPKYCANELISGRHFPDDWQGDIVTNDFRANRIVRYKVTDQDGTFVSKLMPDVITSTDRAFRPVDVKMGPDGALYIADWYNPIINHGEVDFRDPRRDHSHGRIWRLTRKGHKPLQRPNVTDASLDQLLDFLKSPEQWTRHQAKLRMRGRYPEEVAGGLARWVGKLDPKDPDVEHHRLEALWTYQAIDIPNPGLLAALLTSPDYRARAAAARVVPDWADRMPEALDLLAARVTDEHPRVRLEAVAALGRIPQPRSIEIAVQARDKPLTPLIEFALERTANQLKDVWLPEFQAGKLKFGDNKERQNYALRAVNSEAAVAQIVTQLSFNAVPVGQREGALDLLADVGGPNEASLLLQLASRARGDYDDAARARMLARVERMARQRNVRPGGGGKELAGLITADGPLDTRLAALRLAGALKRQDLTREVASAATDRNAAPAVRDAAMAALGETGTGAAVEILRQLDNSQQPYAVRSMAVAALAQVDVKDAARRAAELLSQGPATDDPAQSDPSKLFDAFLQREGGGEALAAALKGKKIPTDVAKLGLRYVNTTGRDDPALTAILRQAAGLNATPRPPTPQELTAIASEVASKGDPAAGELVFRRKDTGCMQCHAVAGAGGQVGPDLRAIGASSPLDYIIESVLVPNKVIKEGYQTVVVATKGGDVFSGIKVKQGDGQMLVRDAQREHVIPLDQVRKEREGGSLMPMGLADALTHKEFIDLVRFLADLGKPGAYGPSATPIVRRWRVLDPSQAAGLAANPDRLASPGSAAALKWTSAYSLVSGDLPSEAWKADGTGPAFVRCDLDVTAPGQIGLRVNSLTGLKLWVDGQPTELKENPTLALQRGVHTLVFQVDPAARGQTPLRVELRDEPGSTGAAQPVGGT